MPTDPLKLSNCATTLNGTIKNTLNEWSQCNTVMEAAKHFKTLEAQAGRLSGPAVAGEGPTVRHWLYVLARHANTCMIQEMSCGLPYLSDNKNSAFIFNAILSAVKNVEKGREDRSIDKFTGKEWAIHWLSHAVGNLRILCRRSGETCPDPNDRERFNDYILWLLVRGTQVESFGLSSAIETLRNALLGLIPAEDATELLWALSVPSVVAAVRENVRLWLEQESEEAFRSHVFDVGNALGLTSLRSSGIVELNAPVRNLFVTLCPQGRRFLGSFETETARQKDKKVRSRRKTQKKDAQAEDAQLGLFDVLGNEKKNDNDDTISKIESKDERPAFDDFYDELGEPTVGYEGEQEGGFSFFDSDDNNAPNESDMPPQEDFDPDSCESCEELPEQVEFEPCWEPS